MGLRPARQERKQDGLAVILYLLIFAGVVYLAYRQVWKGKTLNRVWMACKRPPFCDTVLTY